MSSFEAIEKLVLSKLGEISGTDTEDQDYDSIVELWDKQLKLKDALNRENQLKSDKLLDWYKKAFDYWENEVNCPISDDGVLGGYGAITPQDIKGSNDFLDQIIANYPSFHCIKAADLGAGIGRITKLLLLPRFQAIDLVEQSPRLLDAAPGYIGSESSRVTYILQGLQSFSPPPETYDLIWIQWVIGHLHDLDFIEFFKRCVIGLKKDGIIVLKENFPESYTFALDNNDSSVARCLDYVKVLLSLAGCKVVLESEQVGFPSELYPVWSLAIKPVL